GQIVGEFAPLPAVSLRNVGGNGHRRTTDLDGQSKSFVRREALREPIDFLRQCDSLPPDDQVLEITDFIAHSYPPISIPCPSLGGVRGRGSALGGVRGRGSGVSRESFFAREIAMRRISSDRASTTVNCSADFLNPLIPGPSLGGVKGRGSGVSRESF